MSLFVLSFDIQHGSKNARHYDSKTTFIIVHHFLLLFLHLSDIRLFGQQWVSFALAFLVAGVDCKLLKSV